MEGSCALTVDENRSNRPAKGSFGRRAPMNFRGVDSPAWLARVAEIWPSLTVFLWAHETPRDDPNMLPASSWPAVDISLCTAMPMRTLALDCEICTSAAEDTDMQWDGGHETALLSMQSLAPGT